MLADMRVRNALIALAYGLSLSINSIAETVYHLDIPPGDLTSALELLSAGARLRASGSAPLIPDTLAMRISGYFRHAVGFITDFGVGGSDVNRANDRGGRVSLLYQPFNELSVEITAMDQQRRNRGNDVVDFNPTTGRPLINASSQLRDVLEPSTIGLRVYALTLRYSLDWLDLVAASGYASARPVNVYDTTQLLAEAGYIPATPVTRATSIWSEPVNKITQEIRLVSRRFGPVEWMLGGFFQHESLNGSYLDILYAADGLPKQGPLLGEAHRVGTLTEEAGFGNATIYLTGDVDITAGFRLSRLAQDETRRAKGVTNNPTDPLSETLWHQAFSQTVDTWLATARWRPDDDLTVYGRAASGYRPGGGRDLPPGAPANLPYYYRSDSLWSYETGLKLRAFQHRLNLDLAGFWINWTQIQTLQSVANKLIDSNAGSARSRGFELQAQYSIQDGLVLGVDGAFTDAKFTQSEPSIEVTAGEPLFGVPKRAATVFSSYSRPIGRGWFVQTNGNFQYQSGRLDLSGNPLTAYALWNASVGLHNPWCRITLYVRNITNKRAFLGLGDSGAYSFVVNPPGTFGIGFSQDLR